MKQIIVIHGGTTFARYDDYLEYLRTKQPSIDRLTYQTFWKEGLQDELGAEYQVLLPSMPNKTNAKYSEWKLWFDTLSGLFADDCVLVGHSLGGIFLAKYLSENTFPHRIKATILIAAPFKDESAEDLADFKLTGISDLFRQQTGKVIVFGGEDDPVISKDELQRYKEELPGADFRIMSATDHFMRVDFPELTQVLTEL
jgi:predicted alpha/beta hydrolase family esterase